MMIVGHLKIDTDERVGKDRTTLYENRHITFYENYIDGESTKTRSVSVQIDNVKIDNAVHQGF
jgi:hypothetical protein